MRKFHKAALVFAAAGGLSAIGVGSSAAVAPAGYNGAAPPPIGQPDAHAVSSTSSQATAQSYGSPAPQRMSLPQPSEVSPQVNPQLNPLISPQISPQTAPAAPSGPVDQNNLFRPSQECSPQNLLNANLPVAVLAGAETKGVSCGQANSQANSLAHAH
ncbi:hypothetical protein [Streptomyces sp. NPDC001415]